MVCGRAECDAESTGVYGGKFGGECGFCVVCEYYYDCRTDWVGGDWCYLFEVLLWDAKAGY